MLIPLLVPLYFRRRKVFFITMGGLALVSFIIQTVIIFVNRLSVSYFTYQDEYWTIYYIKPYARIPAFLVGVLAGCSYYSYMREQEEPSKLSRFLSRVSYSKGLSLLMCFTGLLCMVLMIVLMQIINNSPNDVPEFWNFLYLIFSRPLFVTGFSMCIFPVLLGSTLCRPIRQFLAHDFWVPFSRLTYGAYLSHGVFMMFREFNTERG
jgi:ABC-type transport system involved in multi-copper enzyme maturation permease subunit